MFIRGEALHSDRWGHIEGPDAGSVTDIFGAVYIDKVIQEECPFDIEEYNRYRDDTADVNTIALLNSRK